jgi:hypothetical protein
MAGPGSAREKSVAYLISLELEVRRHFTEDARESSNT